MDIKSLLHRLALVERRTHSAVFSLSQARILFPEESDANLRNSLLRHTRGGSLRKVCSGIWFNNYSPYAAEGNLLHQVAALLRPAEFNYISLETVLAEQSVISQQPQGYLTVMTTGPKRLFTTSLGTIEFTHTKRDPLMLLENTTPIPGSPLRRATVARAYADLLRVGRNLEMVDQEELSAVLTRESGDETQRAA